MEPRLVRGRPAYALLALLASFALILAGISEPPAGASGGPTATSAISKKCKKKSYRRHHKKKCRKKKPVVPVVRATLRWDTDPSGQGANLNLFVFDASGAAISNSVQNSFSLDDNNAPGLETFTDLAPRLHRVFSFGVCYAAPDIGSVHATGTIVYVTADGVSHTGSFDLGSKGAHAEFAGGAPIPSNYCL